MLAMNTDIGFGDVALQQRQLESNPGLGRSVAAIDEVMPI